MYSLFCPDYTITQAGSPYPQSLDFLALLQTKPRISNIETSAQGAYMANDTTNKIILVVGATGQQGGAVVRHLLAGGWQLRALSRNPDQPAAQALKSSGVEVAQGELDDPASLEQALQGVYGVFSVQTWAGTAQGIEDQIRQGKALADAVKAAGVEHLVHSSVDGAERGSGIPHFENQWVVEQYIQSLKMPTTILHPVFFMENFNMFFRESVKNGVIAMDLRPDQKLQMIAVDDIGALAAVAFSSPEKFIGQTLKIAGDELTMPQTAQVLSKVLDKPVQYFDNPQMWLGESFLEREFRVMFEWYNNHGYKADIPAIRELYPDLMKLETWLHKTGWGK